MTATTRATPAIPDTERSGGAATMTNAAIAERAKLAA